jgi:hypothetical protein
MSKPLKNHRRELIELAALFAAAGIADLFTDLLGHRIEGPVVLIALGVVVAIATLMDLLRGGRRPRARGASVPAYDQTPTGYADVAGELWRVRTAVQDTPGRLAVLAGAFAAVGANILALQVQPVAGAVVDEFLVEAATNVTADQLGAVVAAAGGGEVHVALADVTSLTDLPTRALTLAHRLIREPEALRFVLAELLSPAQVEWCSEQDDTCGGNETESTIMRVRDPLAGVVRVSRPGIPFTPVESARAQAMADLASAVHALGTPSGALT